MISVTIFINETPIITRGARNTGKKNKAGETIYQCDDGRKIKHKYEDGAVALAKKMLDGVKEI